MARPRPTCAQPWIAESLCISENTVGSHVRHIYQKLDIHSREELFALIDPGEVAPLEGK